MVRLVATETYVIPVHPATKGHGTERLAVERHEFPTQSTCTRKVAFLFSHAMGFHKECLYPLIDLLVTNLRSSKEYDQTSFSVYVFDSRYCGDSAVLNRNISNTYHDFVEGSLDIKQIVDEFGLNKRERYDRFIAFGHSGGAIALLIMEFFYPRTTDGLCLFEPPVLTWIKSREKFVTNPVFRTNKQKNEWANLEEYRKEIEGKFLFKFFHPKVFENYLEYGLYETERGTMALKTSKDREVQIYSTGLISGHMAFKSLSVIQVPTRVLYSGRFGVVELKDYNNITKAERKHRSKMFTTDIIKVKCTHMAPHERPDTIVPYIISVLNRAVSIEEKWCSVDAVNSDSKL